MTARILPKVTMINDQWITVPFIRDERGDRPATPSDAIRSIDINTTKADRK